MLGRIKWWNEVNGYGFIRPDDGGADVFVHFSAVVGATGRRKLEDGQRVEYEVVDGPKGFMASEVRKEEGHGQP